MPFLADIPIKGCLEDEKEEMLGKDGCQKFVASHIVDCEKILERLESARLTFYRKSQHLDNQRSWWSVTCADLTI